MDIRRLKKLESVIKKPPRQEEPENLWDLNLLSVEDLYRLLDFEESEWRDSEECMNILKKAWTGEEGALIKELNSQDSEIRVKTTR